MSGSEQRWRELMLIANPISGKGKGGRYVEAVAEVLRQKAASIHVVRTTGKGDAQEAAADFPGEAIVVLGGDGTINESINGADLERCVIGVVPAGAGNVLGNELRMSKHPLEAARMILDGRVARFDLGVCNGRRFACMCGVGLDAHVVDMVHRKRRGRMTQLRYMPHLLREALLPHRWNIRVDVDGREMVSGADMVCVGNTRAYGGPVSLTPLASPVDGLFDVLAARMAAPGGAALQSLAALLRSSHACATALYYRGSRVTITSRRTDVPWQVDGEFRGHLPAEIHIEPGRFRLIVPRAFRSRPPADIRKAGRETD